MPKNTPKKCQLLYCCYGKKLAGHDQNTLDKRQKFIDDMHNYFGIEDKSELAYFGVIYDKVVLPYIADREKKMLEELLSQAIPCESFKRTKGYGTVHSQQAVPVEIIRQRAKEWSKKNG